MSSTEQELLAIKQEYRYKQALAMLSAAADYLDQLAQGASTPSLCEYVGHLSDDVSAHRTELYENKDTVLERNSA